MVFRAEMQFPLSVGNGAIGEFAAAQDFGAAADGSGHGYLHAY